MLRDNGGAVWLDAKTGELIEFKDSARLEEALAAIKRLPIKEAKLIEESPIGNKYVYKTTVDVNGQPREVIEILMFSRKDAENLVKKAEIDLAKAVWQKENLERLSQLACEDIERAEKENMPLTYSRNYNRLMPLELPQDKQIEKDAFSQDEAKYWQANMDKYGNTYWLKVDLSSGIISVVVNSLDGSAVLTKEFAQKIDEVATTYWQTLRGQEKLFDEKEYRKIGDVPYSTRNLNGDEVCVYANEVKFKSEKVKIPSGMEVELEIPDEISATTYHTGWLGNLRTKEILSGDNVVLDKYTYFNVEGKDEEINVKGKVYKVHSIGPYALKISSETDNDGFYTGKGSAKVVRMEGGDRRVD